MTCGIKMPNRIYAWVSKGGYLNWGFKISRMTPDNVRPYICEEYHQMCLQLASHKLYSRRQLEQTNKELVAALKAMRDEKVDYMRINNLGVPEEQHTIKMADAALAKAKGGDLKWIDEAAVITKEALESITKSKGGAV